MRAVSVMLKPSSSLCNMRCEYCFYHSLAAERESPSHGLMSEGTLARTLSRAFEYADGAPVYLSFQGGEPLLSGKEFFLRAAELIRTLNTRGSRVSVGVQTNGTLLDDEWCKLFARQGWLVGLSLDGDRTRTSHRIFADGSPAFDAICAGAKLLQKNRAEFNVLSVLTRPVADNIERVWAFFRKNGFRHLQFIPVLKPLPRPADVTEAKGREAADGSLPDTAEWALTEQSYLNFLKKAFSLYMKDMIDGRYTSVRLFDNFVRLANFGRAEQCGMGGSCSQQFVVEGDGATYPCDFYCLDEYCLGNVHGMSFAEMEESERAKRFLAESAEKEERCKSCKYARLCGGGCKRERIDLDKCEAHKAFFEYALPHMKRMS